MEFDSEPGPIPGDGAANCARRASAHPKGRNSVKDGKAVARTRGWRAALDGAGVGSGRGRKLVALRNS
jgi:hypothetical protein